MKKFIVAVIASFALVSALACEAAETKEEVNLYLTSKPRSAII